jgi:hypothetical protein
MLYCPRCESEFVPSASRCESCDVALVSDLAAVVDQVDEMPPINELVCVRAASMGWAQGLSESLAEAGISHRIEAVRDDEDDDALSEAPNARLPFGVWVLEADLVRARSIDEDYLSGQIPDLPTEGTDDEAAGDACPACGDAVPESASECPGCGLAMIFDG